MNSDSESLQSQELSRLLVNYATTEIESFRVKGEGLEGAHGPGPTTAASRSGDFESGNMLHTFQLGEIPTVQERFQAVLRRRLQTHFQNNPPLFPWETQLAEYPDYVDSPSIALVPNWGWTAQQHKLSLPITLPDKIFQHLLGKCQELISSSLPLGAKLVQAVENLFPDETQTLNDIAGVVLRSAAYRSADALETIPNLESDYSDLQPRQQMALSILAAKQLLENLTLPISVAQPVVERQWLTNAGVLALKVEYQSQSQVAQLRVQGELPAKGILKLRGSTSQALAESSSPGYLSVELGCVQMNQTYTLEVELKEIDQQPLLFVIIPTM